MVDIDFLIEIAFKEVNKACENNSKEIETLKEKIKDILTLTTAMDKKFDEILIELKEVKNGQTSKANSNNDFYDSYKNGEV